MKEKTIEIIENSEKINSSRIRKAIEDNKEKALLNKKLITVNKNEEGITLVTNGKNYNPEELMKIFKDLKLNSLLEALGLEDVDGKTSAEEVIKVIDNIEDFKEFMKTLKERVYIGYESSNSNVYSKIKIELLNGSGDKTLLNKATKALKAEGYNVYKTGTTTTTAKTAIINKTAVKNSIVDDIKDVLGVGNISSSVSSSSTVDIRIIIGKDYK